MIETNPLKRTTVNLRKVRMGTFSVFYIIFFSDCKQVQRLEGFFNEAINRCKNIADEFL